MNQSQENISPNISSPGSKAEEGIFVTDYGNHTNVVLPDTTSKSGQKVIPCSDVRGGLVWPSELSPGYYCIFGQLPDVTNSGKHPLMFITEKEFELPRHLFTNIAADSKRFKCQIFYNDKKKDNQDLLTLFYEFCRYQRTSTISIEKSPLIGKFHIGIKFLQEWDNDEALDISRAVILKQQLQRIQKVDLDEDTEEYYAIKALQYIVASVEKTPWKRTFNVVDKAAYERSRAKADPQGWT